MGTKLGISRAEAKALFVQIGWLVFAFIGVAILKAFGWIPFELFQFWKLPDLGALVSGYWWLIVWAVGLNALLLFGQKKLFGRIKPYEDPWIHIRTSFYAGVLEEIEYRWLVFYGEIVGLTVFNFIFGGFLVWFGLPHWGLMENLLGNITVPIADLATFLKLHAYLFTPLGWAVGAAIVTANVKFRDEHKYLGPLGVINAWYLGMVMFHIVFTQGIIAAMIAHMCYDWSVNVLHISAAWLDSSHR